MSWAATSTLPGTGTSTTRLHHSSTTRAPSPQAREPHGETTSPEDAPSATVPCLHHPTDPTHPRASGLPFCTPCALQPGTWVACSLLRRPGPSAQAAGRRAALFGSGQLKDRALSTGLRRHCHPRKAAHASSVSWAEISLQVSQGHLLLTQPSSFVHSFIHSLSSKHTPRCGLGTGTLGGAGQGRVRCSGSCRSAGGTGFTFSLRRDCSSRRTSPTRASGRTSMNEY